MVCGIVASTVKLELEVGAWGGARILLRTIMAMQ